VAKGLADGSLHPNSAKRELARAVVDLYHGPGAGEAAERAFDLVHREHEVPEDVERALIPADAVHDGRIWLPRLLVTVGLAGSNAEARRHVEGGGVRLDGEVLADPEQEFELTELDGRVLSLGRRRFLRLAR
jgi:tyrosyl-tRNA synthetase